jgi:hypothetical protein
MSQSPTLQDEYQMLIGELRQNREIQLQSLLAIPIWLSLFFGLVSAGGPSALKTMPFLVLIPVPLVFLSLLLVVDRRGSSDRIIAYMRTAFDQRLADEIGWNLRLPEFRRDVKALRNERHPSYVVPQRSDFTLIVWASHAAIASICFALYCFLVPTHGLWLWAIGAIVALAFLGVLFWIFHQSALKPYFVEAWTQVLKREMDNSAASADQKAPLPGR